MEDINNLIEQYYELSNYGSAEKICKFLKIDGITMKLKTIKEYLNKKEEVQLVKEDKQTKNKFQPIIALEPNDIWCMDIFVLIKYHKSNDGYAYILAVVDVFTRKAYCVPMRAKGIEDVCTAFQEILKISGAVPKVILSDSDSSFTGHEFQKILLKHDIIHNTVIINDHHTLGIIDRFARTLKTILSKLFIKNKNTNWIKYLDSVIERYNNTPHSGIVDIKPNDAHIEEYKNIILEINQLKSKVEKPKNPFNIDDKVRIREKGIFKKGTESRFSDDVFIVVSISGSTVKLNNGKNYRSSSLQKIDKNYIIPEKGVKNVIRRATKERTVELLHKRIDVQAENIIQEPRVRKKKTYDD